jgi:3-dehydroquinate synthase
MNPAPPERVRVDTPGGCYEILIGPGLLRQPESLAGLPRAAAAVVVTNPTVDALHGPALRSALAPHYARVDTVQLPDGEQFKDWLHLNRIFDHLLAAGHDRRTVSSAT